MIEDLVIFFFFNSILFLFLTTPIKPKILLIVAQKVDKIDVEAMAYPQEIAKEKDLFDIKHGGVGKLVKVNKKIFQIYYSY